MRREKREGDVAGGGYAYAGRNHSRFSLLLHIEEDHRYSNWSPDLRGRQQLVGTEAGEAGVQQQQSPEIREVRLGFAVKCLRRRKQEAGVLNPVPYETLKVFAL